jgi:transcription antitermination factor NusG
MIMQFSTAVRTKENVLYQPTEKKWFALYTRSRYEKKVSADLQEIGIETWVPLQKTLRQWSDRKKWVEAPLFHSYVFIYTDQNTARFATRVDGAVYVVSFAGKLVSIPQVQIESLKLLLDSSEKFEISFDEFTFGEHIEVNKGPLQGVKGTFVNFKGKKRLLMHIDAINQKLLVEINPGFVKKIPVEPVVNVKKMAVEG